LAELELPFLSPLVRFVDVLHDLWVKVLRQAGNQAIVSDFNVFRIPFVDYARGDGVSIGDGLEKCWQPALLTEKTHWAIGYRGLWGLYAQDPISGENAPAGPVYNRDGNVRRSWFDPIGWAGLDKLPPLDERPRVLEKKLTDIQSNQGRLQALIEEKSSALVGLGVEAAAVQGYPHLVQAHTILLNRIQAGSGELKNLRQDLALENARLEALLLYQKSIEQGNPGPMRAHIHRAHRSSPPGELLLASIAEFIAAISIGVLMVGVVFLIVFARQYLLIGLAALIGLLIFVEAGFRRQLPRLINSLTVGLAVVSALVLLFEFFWQIVIVAVLAAGLFIMYENLREIAR
jgi:hypothetical protein